MQDPDTLSSMFSTYWTYSNNSLCFHSLSWETKSPPTAWSRFTIKYAWRPIYLLPLCEIHSSSLFTVTAAKPDLIQLQDIDLPSRVGPKIKPFGTYLLRDNLGDKMANITESCRENPEKMAMEVLRRWLQGKGVEVSWESLIATLRKSKLKLMADQIQIALDQLRSWCIVLHLDNGFLNYGNFFLSLLVFCIIFWHGRLWSDMKITFSVWHSCTWIFNFFTPCTFK